MAYYNKFFFNSYAKNISTVVTGLIFITLSACNGPAGKQTSGDTVATTDSSGKQTKPLVADACFSRTEGKNNEDMTVVRLKMVGDSVSGQMTWLPYQKDSRKGLLKGIKNGNEIKAVWSFSQEGVADTLSMQFKLDGNKLLQKPLTLNQKTGRQVTDAQENYTITFNATDCDKVWVK